MAENPKQLINLGKDEPFLGLLEQVERFVSKVLSAALVIVILVATVDLGIFPISRSFYATPRVFQHDLN